MAFYSDMLSARSKTLYSKLRYIDIFKELLLSNVSILKNIYSFVSTRYMTGLWEAIIKVREKIIIKLEWIAQYKDKVDMINLKNAEDGFLEPIKNVSSSNREIILKCSAHFQNCRHWQ